MGSRQNLHDELKELLGTEEVHFQPPESKKLKYPCIVYSRAPGMDLSADNQNYHHFIKYNLTFMTSDPDDPIINSLISHFRMCKLVRTNCSSYLNHYHYDLYY